MAVKTNILLSSINGASNSLTLMILLSIVAGASEQLLPNLISRFSAVLDKQKLEIVVEENAAAVNAGSTSADPGSPTEKTLPDDDKKENKKEKPPNPELVEK
jgi:hypothetical protein